MISRAVAEFVPKRVIGQDTKWIAWRFQLKFSKVRSGGSAEGRFQNRNRNITWTDLAPPFWKMGVNPLPGLPLPSIMFSIETDCPKSGLDRKRKGSAKLGWFNALNASIRN